MKKTIIISVAVAIVGLIIFQLFRNYNQITSSVSDNKYQTETVSVTVFPVEYKTIRQEHHLVGTLNPIKEINIVSQSQGILTSMNIELGKYVSKGSIIATIDNEQKLLTVETNKLSVSKLEKDLARYKNLFKGGTITEQQLDEMQNAYDNAVIQLKQAQKQLNDAIIISPISGIVSAKNIELGAFVTINSPLATLVDISKLKIKLNVSESLVYQLSLKDTAIINTPVFTNTSLVGLISYISPCGDAAHNYEVIIEIDNHKKNPLKAGTFVNVAFNLKEAVNTLVIPRQALQGSVDDAKVFIAQNDVAQLKKIKIKEADNNYLEVISGLSEGEKVIVTGLLNLENGKRINIINTK